MSQKKETEVKTEETIPAHTQEVTKKETSTEQVPETTKTVTTEEAPAE